ncbi:hypothetical protein TI39_contig844g00015 [Zymoseptoria brevis]|uniref:Uncharacterized protein n=1 Tax=Zymoseptoria brevis TaxID=1047168 RepID=A0A0F4GFG5_9PEZI|nr:hypothetical protein TI39_contig844g00015 [Zymoseptoria brevis]
MSQFMSNSKGMTTPESDGLGDSKKSPELNSVDGDAPEVIDVDALPALPKHNRIAVLSGHLQANGSKRSTANKSKGGKSTAGKSTASNTTASNSTTRDVMAGSLFQSNLCPPSRRMGPIRAVPFPFSRRSITQTPP